jgi:hypothetical protein
MVLAAVMAQANIAMALVMGWAFAFCILRFMGGSFPEKIYDIGGTLALGSIFVKQKYIKNIYFYYFL